MKKFFLLLGFLMVCPPAAPAAPPVREKLLFDFGWKFHLGDAASPQGDFGYGLGALFAKAGDATGPFRPDFNDSAWQSVHLPHDWVVELPFVNVNDEDVKSHGYKPVGRQFPATSIGWYRRAFVIPQTEEGRRLCVRFDGVFRDCMVWLNGHYLGRNLSGYSEFTFDISDYLHYGQRNVLAVRVDATQFEGWFYEGAGIYRHAWLLISEPVHIPEYGIFVHTSTTGARAVIHAETTIDNQSDNAAVLELRTTVIDDQGKPAGAASAPVGELAAGEQRTVKQTVGISPAHLWSLEDPYLYTLITRIYRKGVLVDSVSTSFGIRTIMFDNNRGFFLNGRSVKLKGVCCHQDHAGVGSALPDRLQYYRIERLKEMGCNAYRTSHNPPTRELLDACDRLGMLVMDENRLLGSSPDLMEQFRRLILRDRNHPSVAFWSIGNEEWMIQNDPVGRRLAQSLLRVQAKLDPTRLCTYAANNGNRFEGINSVMPIRGINYMNISDIDKYRKDHPGQILLGSEEASTLCTRGIYANDTLAGYVTDYDQNKPGWGATAEQWWKFYDARPWLAGAFVWTGFDYRGEPTPYSWPCINSHFGVMDVCGFPKNNYYYYQAWWSDRDVLHVVPHWNWKGKEGTPVNVWCESNCDSVELKLNGTVLGRKVMEHDGHLEWNVAYQPGVLEANGWRHGTKLTARVQTTGEPAALVLHADRMHIGADGQDVSIVTVTVTDTKGLEVPDAGNLIHYELSGPAAIIGVGNGDPSSHEADKCPEGGWSRHLFSGKCQCIIQSSRATGTIRLRAAAEGLTPAEIAIQSDSVALEPAVE